MPPWQQAFCHARPAALTYHASMPTPEPQAPSPDLITLHLDIVGHVQGVGYRVSMQAVARQLQVQGWVRNRRDGRVEALIQGPRKAVERMLAWCHDGPPTARVAAVRQAPQLPDCRWPEFACRETAG